MPTLINKIPAKQLILFLISIDHETISGTKFVWNPCYICCYTNLWWKNSAFPVNVKTPPYHRYQISNLNTVKPRPFLGFWSLAQSLKCIIVPRKTEIRVDEGRKRGEKKGHEEKGKEMRTLRVSKFKTMANKSQSVALLQGDAWIISQCQVKWLPISTPKTPPSRCPPILSCHTVFSSTSSRRRVVGRWCWWWVGGGL